MSLTSEYHATHRFARISVRKVRPLLDLIRGHYADDALDVLKYMPHRGARLVEQVLKSAMANAEDKGIRNVGELIVVDARGDGGPDVQAADAPGPRHGVPDSPPHGAHRHRARRPGELGRRGQEQAASRRRATNRTSDRIGFKTIGAVIENEDVGTTRPGDD